MLYYTNKLYHYYYYEAGERIREDLVSHSPGNQNIFAIRLWLEAFQHRESNLSFAPPVGF